MYDNYALNLLIIVVFFYFNTLRLSKRVNTNILVFIDAHLINVYSDRTTLLNKQEIPG